MVDQCLARGIKPFLGGRNAEKLKNQAEKHSLDYLAFDVSDKDRLHEFLSMGSVLLHCAGPFIHTSQTVLDACFQTNTHYLDITGEYQVFDLCQAHSEKFKSQNLTVVPGVGFDVVPSDCLAAMLKAEMPDATDLQLAFVNKGAKMSRGTLKTMIENLGDKQVRRENGQYAYAPMGQNTLMVDFGDFEQICMAISWGDISTAYFSTDIPNIQVFAGTEARQVSQVRKMQMLSWFFRMKPVKRYLQRKLDSKPDGPSDQKREKSVTFMWGSVSNGNTTVEKRLRVPNGYTVTADSSVRIAQEVLNGNFKPGYQTPSSAYGKDFVLALDGVEEL